MTKPPIKIKYSQQEILNQSFDEDYGLLVVEGSGFDGQNAQRQNASNLATRLAYDVSGNPIYVGIAAPGSLTSEAKWQVRKLTFDLNGNVTVIEYAGGLPNFSYKWDSRLSLVYS